MIILTTLHSEHPVLPPTPLADPPRRHPPRSYPLFYSPLPYPPPTRNRIGASRRTIGNNLPPFLSCAHRCVSEFGPALQAPQYTLQSPPKSHRCMCRFISTLCVLRRTTNLLNLLQKRTHCVVKTFLWWAGRPAPGNQAGFGIERAYSGARGA